MPTCVRLCAVGRLGDNRVAVLIHGPVPGTDLKHDSDKDAGLRAPGCEPTRISGLACTQQQPLHWPSTTLLRQQNKERPLKTIEQTPTWLPAVEANPQPSPYADLIRIAKEGGREHWQIWHLFAFRPEVTSPLASFTEGVMRSPAPISGGLRELIAAYTSWTNKCEFCWRSHAAVAAEMLGSEELVRGVLEDVETSSLPEPEKALMRFARKMTQELPEMREEDVEELRKAGWDDEAIYYTIMVVALFNFYNRWVTTSGVHPVSDEVHRMHGKRLASSGYEPKNRQMGIKASGNGA